MAARLTTIDAHTALPRPAAAPLSGWRRALGDTLVVGGATAVCHALGAVTSLLLRVLLSPAQMGVWQGLKLFLTYGNYANLGISKGAARELAIARGSGDTRRARDGLNLAFTVNSVSSLVYAALLMGAGLWIGVASDSPFSAAWAWGLVIVGGVTVLQRYVTFQVTILRTEQAFTLCSQVALLEAVLTLAVCGLAVWWLGLAGLYVGTLVVLVGTLLYLRRHGAPRFGWAWNRPEVRRLMAIGAPILLAGTVSSLLRSLDRWMILAYLPDREYQLGCYSLALMVTTQLYGLANMVAVAMGPRYGETYGHAGRREPVARLAARASEIQAAAIGLPAALAIVAAPPILAWMLPDYRPGLAPIVWLVPGVIALALALPASQYLVAVDRQRRALVAIVAATALAVAGNHFALVGGYGLVGVAAATAGAYAAYFLLTAAVSIWAELDAGDRLRYVAALAMLLAPVLGAALALERAWPAETADWLTTVLKALTVTATFAASAAVVWHRGGWHAELRTP